MSLLNKKINGSLQDGKYMVQLTGAKDIPAKDGVAERVVVMAFIPALNRTIEISMFEKQLDYMTRDLINEYFPNSSMNILEVLDALKTQEIPMWVARKVVDDLDSASGKRTYVNYYFHEYQERSEVQTESATPNGSLQFN